MATTSPAPTLPATAATAPTARVAGGWPVAAEDIGPWASGYHPALVGYLRGFGTAIVSVTGDPDRLQAAAATWEQAASTLDDLVRRLDATEQDIPTWRGAARTAYEHARAVTRRRFADEAPRARATAGALRSAAAAEGEARAAAIGVTAAFLGSAEAARLRALAVPMTAGGPLVAWRTELVRIFADHADLARNVVEAFRARMAEVVAALESTEPSWVGQAARRVGDFVHYDVPERLDELVNLPVYRDGRIPTADLGSAAAIDSLVKVWAERGHLTTPETGAVGSYAGATVGPLACVAGAGAGSVATARVPWLSRSLGKIAAACAAAEAASYVVNKQPSVQALLGWAPDSVLPDGAAVRLGVRDAGALPTLWAGRSRAWAWEAEDHKVRLGCTRFDYLATPTPRTGLAWLNGTFSTMTTDAKVSGGVFSELNAQVGVPGGRLSARGWHPVAGSSREGALFCGVYMNLTWR
ncbi:hypothetical protein [Kineosporia sp. A_224]|uniref:hypothetical protein n=1 Tax=Kineosporia sp. A_224 TaxID=1962180 RepID=UPI000B4B2A40|nr:hypothetical protein [Kineosporia sp. A_224]